MGNNVLYRAFSIGVKQRRLIKFDENYIETAQKIMGDDYDSKDFYESIYLYGEEHFNQFQETGSLAGIKGVKTDRIVFDFDSKKDVSVALNDAREVVSRLQNDFDDQSIRIFYSGGKGFHVEVHLTDKMITREQFELITSKYADGLSTFDEKVKDEQRLFRLPLTKNLGSGRFKIPLTIVDLNTLDVVSIQKKSLLPNYDDLIPVMDNWTSSKFPKVLQSLKKEEKKVEVDLNDIFIDERPDFSRNNTGLTPAKFALQEGFFEEGERNEACMILCATYKFLGYNKEVAYNMLKSSLRLRSKRLGLPELSEQDRSELWLTVVDYVYSEHYNGGTFSEEEGLLSKIKERFHITKEEEAKSSFVYIGDVENKFIDFSKNFEKNRVKTGYTTLDEDLLMTSGMMVGFIGAPSSAKTTHTLNFMEYNSKNGIHCLFGSHDMYDVLLYTRLLQRYCGYDMKKIMNMIEHNSPDKKLKDAFELVKENFKNVGFNFQAGPSVDDIQTSIDRYQDKTGAKLKILCVDYLEKIRTSFSDANASAGYAASRLADIARENDLLVMLLLQTQKHSGDPSDPLLSMRKAKLSSVIEQDSRVIMTTWRPGFNPEDNSDDNYSCISVVKNNMGPVATYNFHYDGVSGKVRSLITEEEADFERVVADQKRRKADKNSGSGELF